MFNLFKKKGHVLGAPAKGKAVPLQEVSDPTFAEEMLGKGERSMRRPTERSEWYSIRSTQSAWLRISVQRC